MARYSVAKETNVVLTDEIRVDAFDGHARYWRLMVIDNWGGTGVGIRELSLFGYDEEIAVSEFAIDNSGVYVYDLWRLARVEMPYLYWTALL